MNSIFGIYKEYKIRPWCNFPPFRNTNKIGFLKGGKLHHRGQFMIVLNTIFEKERKNEENKIKIYTNNNAETKPFYCNKSGTVLFPLIHLFENMYTAFSITKKNLIGFYCPQKQQYFLNSKSMFGGNEKVKKKYIYNIS